MSEMVKYKGNAVLKRRKSCPVFHHLWHSPYKKVGDLLEVDFGVSIVVELQNRTPKNGDIEVGFGAKQLTKGDWGNKSLERHDQMGKEWLLELVTLTLTYYRLGTWTTI